MSLYTTCEVCSEMGTDVELVRVSTGEGPPEKRAICDECRNDPEPGEIYFQFEADRGHGV